MKKSLISVLKKLSVDNEEKLSGGFLAIKGGKALDKPLPNTGVCTNAACAADNTGQCTNTTTCTGSNGGIKCSNSGVCS
ncbi:MAG: hypothetical protein M3O71_07250 [Bacteroidota bacterium]|nr:hypothetical protein [Bacteroidota bacterium]